jgi:hypothetical protein
MGDAEKRRHGDGGQERGNTEPRLHVPVSVSPRLRITVSPRPRVPAISRFSVL